MREHALVGAAVNGYATVLILKTVSDVKNVTGINVTPDNVIYIATARQKSNSRGMGFVPAVGEPVALGKRR